MMTRSPVMVTLSDAADHIAEFRDTHQRYDLTKKSDVSKLCVCARTYTPFL